MRMRALLVGVFTLALGSAWAVQMPWAKDWSAATKAAATSGKLIMLDFYTEW